jgi:hypothetical protein
VFCDKLRYFALKKEFTSTALLLDDSKSCLIIWFTDINGDTPFKSTLETWFEFCKLLGWTITRKYNLLPCFIQDIEDIVQLFLGLLLSSKKLYIIKNQYIDLSIFFTEFVDRTSLDA